ncbi:MAG: hypothetical protein ACXVJO_16065, partial [Thermoanaerobaculia bacterium]
HRNMVAATLLVFATLSASAQSVASTPHGVLVAHDSLVQLFRDDRPIWSGEGPANPRAIIVGDDRVAILDPLANEARIVDLASGRGRTVSTAETPVDGVFANNDFYVISRDAGTVERLGGARLAIGADPAFIRTAGGRLYIYQRLKGSIVEITTAPFAIAREMQIAPFASDFETDGRNGYLALPRVAKIATFSIAQMKATGMVDVGAVPVDIALGGGGGALSARSLAVADPSGKRVWMIEGSQSLSQALSRGFLRGLLGLGLYSNSSAQFPTGVDRVFSSAGRWFAYDSSSGTLYRFAKAKSTVIATDLPPNAFAVTPDGVAFWKEGRLHLAV